MAIRTLTEATIRQHAYGDAFERGQEYYREGAVRSVFRRGDKLEALVQGNETAPCRVRCTFDRAGVRNVSCGCHDASSSWCEHVVAVLFAVAQGDVIEDGPPLDERLKDIDRGKLESLILRLAARDPDLLQAVEDDLAAIEVAATSAAAPATPAPPPASIDRNEVRRQARAGFSYEPPSRSRWSNWSSFHVGSDVSDVLEQAWSFIRAGDGRTALDILNVVTDTYFDDIEQILMWDEEGESLDFIGNELGPVWTEAILSADLTPNEREGWISKLDAWSAQLEEYTDGEAFDPALGALQQWWDDPELQRLLQGEMKEPEPVELGDGYVQRIRQQLAVARLNVLERSGRFDEFLNLARSEGEIARYTTMLARLGRIEEAADYGLTWLQSAEDALLLAQAIREAGDLERSLQVAEHGLTLPGRKAPLGVWLADLAAGMGRMPLAVQAAIVSFDEERSLASYLRVQDLAGVAWPEQREQLLDRLRKSQSFYPSGPIDIFLHEGLVGDAIALLDRERYASPDLIGRVAEAAMDTHPDWVIRVSCRQAESIMDAKKAEKYGVAADWLRKVKRAHQAARREGEWKAYLNELMDKHQRKHKLMPLLKALA